MSNDLQAEQQLFVDTPARRAVRRFSRHRLAMLGLGVLLIMVTLAVLAPVVAPHSPTKQELSLYRKPPTQTHWLGTDSLGRDVFSRLIHAGRVSLSVGLVAVGIYETIAILLGAIAGYYGSKLDWIIMRAVDVVMTIPTMIIIIFLVSILGPSMYNSMLAIGIMGWPEPTRLVRGQILSLREMGLRDRSALAWFAHPPDHPAPRTARCGSAAGSSRHLRRSRRHSHRSRSLIPRPGCAAPHSQLGKHDELSANAEHSGARAVAVGTARCRHYAFCALDQFHW